MGKWPGWDMKSMRERYHTDAQFHALVDHMVAMIHQSQFTPSEMREAAILASIRYEELHLHNMRYVVPDVEEALRIIQAYIDKRMGEDKH